MNPIEILKVNFFWKRNLIIKYNQLISDRFIYKELKN